MTALEEFTVDQMNSLTGLSKALAKQRYEEWRAKQRQQDKREAQNIRSKIWRVKNAELKKKVLKNDTA